MYLSHHPIQGIVHLAPYSIINILQATLGLLLVEAGRRRRASGRNPIVKDSDSGSTDGSTKSREQKESAIPPCDSQVRNSILAVGEMKSQHQHSAVR